MQEKGFSSHEAYSLSKLASQFFTKDLSDRVQGRDLTVNCLDPGTVNTKMLYAGWGPCGIDIKVNILQRITEAYIIQTLDPTTKSELIVSGSRVSINQREVSVAAIYKV